MNYMQLFANGGLTKAERIEGEQNAENLLDTLQAIGIDMEQAVNVLNSLKDNPETISQISNYANTINNPSSSEESKSTAVEELLKIFKPSMFKCGGKLQQLVTKFGKGGGVDCGCGGIKLDDGGKTLSDRASRIITQKDTTDWYPFKNGIIRSVHPTNGDAPTYQVFDGTTLIAPKYSVAPKLENEIGIFARPFQYFGAARRITPEKAAEYEEARQSIFNVPAKQSGGNIELTPLPGHDVDTRLTRRQARELARVNGMSENNEQFSFAMANAMNAARAMGLRGQEARQRAREMAAGITPAERSINVPTASTFGNITPIKEGDLRSQTPTQVSVQEPISQPIASTQEQPLDNLSFAQAFAQSRKSGAKTFNWRGKSYGTNLAEKSNTVELPGVTVIGQRSNNLVELPEVEVVGHRAKPESYILGYLGTQLPEVEVVGNRSKPESYTLGYLGNMLPEVEITGHKPQQSYTLGYLGTELPEVQVIGNRPKPETHTLGYLGNMLPEITVTGNKKPQSSYTLGYLGTELPEAIINGYRNIQTPVPVSKQSGQLGKDISKTLKCGGKVKKAQKGESLYELPEVVVEPEWKTLEQTGFFKKNNDPIKFETEDNVNQLITSPKGTISLNIRHNDTPKQDSTFTVMAKRPNSEQFSVTRTYSYPGGDTNAKPYYVDDIDGFERAKKWWNYYKNKTK